MRFQNFLESHFYKYFFRKRIKEKLPKRQTEKIMIYSKLSQNFLYKVFFGAADRTRTGTKFYFRGILRHSRPSNKHRSFIGKQPKDYLKIIKKAAFLPSCYRKKNFRFLSYFCSFPKFPWPQKSRRKHRPAGFFCVKNDQKVSFSLIPVGLSGALSKFRKFVFCLGAAEGRKRKK